MLFTAGPHSNPYFCCCHYIDLAVIITNLFTCITLMLLLMHQTFLKRSYDMQQSIEFAFIPSNKFLITQYMERHISEDLVKRRSSCLLHNQTQPKRQWASPWLPALWATSCLITDHPSSCRVSWPLASWLFGLSLHLILLFSGPCTVLLSSSILSPHTHSSIHIY